MNRFDTPEPTAKAVTLQLLVLDGFEIEIDGNRLNIGGAKAKALLALLVIEAPRRCSRERLRGILWSDSDEEAAQNSLRNALWSLRTALQEQGYVGLMSNRREVWIEPGHIVTDLQIAEAELSGGLVSGKLFPDAGFPDLAFSGLGNGDLLGQTLDIFRLSARRRVMDRAKAALAAEMGQDHLGLLSLLSALEPENETHCRGLIAALAGQGRKTEALAAYQRLWTFLDQQYGEEPSRQTQDAIVALKLGADAKPRMREGKPVVILQPPSQSGENAAAHILALQAQLHDLALSTLTRFREWRIIDGKFSPDLTELRQHADGPLFSLSIPLLPSARAVPRASAILTDFSSGQVLWSETVVFAVEGHVPDLELAVRRLATSMNLHLTAPARKPGQRPQDMSGLLYERWLEAQGLMRVFTQASWNAAEAKLDGILAESPQFVRALASRASLETMRHFAFPGMNSTADLHRKALRWANAATLADPMDSRAQIALAWACAMSRQFDRAELAFELAFQHNENDPWTITSALVGLAFCNRIARSESLISYLMDLHLPLTPFHWSYVAAAKFLAGDDAGCVAMSVKAEECTCDVPAWHAAALALLGRKTEAVEVAERFRHLARKDWVHANQPKDVEMTAWLLGCFPIRSRSQWARLRRGLVLAGLKVPGQ